MKPRRVLFIGLGWEQSDLARRLRRAGHALVQGRDPLAFGALEALAREKKVSAIVSDQCDYSRYAEETLSRALGLPTRAAGTAVGVSKLLQRTLARGKVRQPAFRVCHDLRSTLAAYEALGGDVMVKPSDARGSLGVSRVQARGSLESAYFRARLNGVTGPVIVERRLPGELVTFDGVLRGGRFALKAVSRSTHAAGEAVRLKRHVYYRPEDQPELARRGAPLVSRLCRAFGMTDGFVHSEWLHERGLAFVELANRAPGIRAISRMIEPLCGEDLYAQVYPELLAPAPPVPARYSVQTFHFGPLTDAGRPFLNARAKAHPRLADQLAWPRKRDGSRRVVRLGHATFAGPDLRELTALAASCGARSL